MRLEIILQKKQELFLKCVEETRHSFFGGAKGGGKSGGLRRIVLLRRFEFPGSTGAIFRKTYPELEGNHIRKLFSEYPELRNYYNDSKKLLTLPNGSSLEFCYARNEKDLGNYQGREWDDLAIDEAGEWTEQLIRRLLQSNRSAKPGVKPRAIMTGNPGGVGHAFLKRVFVQRKFKNDERPEDYAFVQALVDDNPALIENDPEYVRTLNAEPNEALRRAYRFGDWDIYAGQFFQDIDRKTHLVPDFDIPHHWNKFCAYDYGFNHPAVFGWFAVDSDGNVYLYRMLAKAKTYVETYARECLSLEEATKDLVVWAGHDCWAAKAVMKEKNPPTVAEEFSANGIPGFRRATIDRIPGASQVRSYLQPRAAANGQMLPRFRIFESCSAAFDCLARMVHDPNRIEDVLKVDATEGDPDTGDDIYDMLRHGLMSRPPIADTPKIYPKMGSKEHSDFVAQELFRNHVEKLERERRQEDGQGFNWQLDQQGIPSWQKWDDF
jgi:phage terminase large subunit